MATAVRSRTEEARELALRLIGERPGVQQRELAAQIEEETGLALSTATRLLRTMEREGMVEGRLDGRRKAYALPEAVAAAAGGSRGSRGELVALVTVLFVAASLIAFALAPDKGDGGGSSSEAPAAPAVPAPAPRPKPKPTANPRPKRSRGAQAAARRTEVAVLSGSPVAGIAAKTGAALKRKGFRVGTVGNAPAPSARSTVLYAPGKRQAARALARSERIGRVARADAPSRALAGSAGLIVIVGADRRR